MTTILLILLAAVGIGGGLAASGGSSGGSDSGYETPVQPGEKPEIISLLTSIDRYQQTQQVGEISVAESTLIVSGERPVVENGRFKYNIDPDRGELEDVYEPYTVSIGANDYTHSDTYADYYEHQGTAIKGLYNNKELSSEPDNWIYMEAVPRDILALGGQKLGLKNSDFGYHNNSISFSPFGELLWYEPFYLYDTTKIASSNRTDTATYQGHLLGGVELVETESGYSAGEDFLPFTGDINLNIDFANRTLNGDMATALASLSWYKFNLSGNLSSSSDFNVNSVSINHNSQPDSALSKYSLNSVNYATGSGKLLEGETQDEIVGKLSFWGENSQYSIFVNTSFGAISPKPEAPVIKPNYNLISALTDKQQYPDVTWEVPTDELAAPAFYTQSGFMKPSAQLAENSIMLTTAAPILNNGVFSNHTFNGLLSSEINFQPETVYLTEANLTQSTAYEKIYTESKSWTGQYKTGTTSSPQWTTKRINRLNVVGLGGSKLGLTASDFGYWKVSEEGSFWHLNVPYYYLYMYDNTKLAKNIQQDSAQLKGYLLPNHYEMNMNFNFVTNKLTGNVFDSSAGSNLFDYTGDVYNAGFRLQSIAPDSQTGSYWWGNGTLLTGNAGLEAVGYIANSNQRYSFGAKEIK